MVTLAINSESTVMKFYGVGICTSYFNYIVTKYDFWTNEYSCVLSQMTFTERTAKCSCTVWQACRAPPPSPSPTSCSAASSAWWTPSSSSSGSATSSRPTSTSWASSWSSSVVCKTAAHHATSPSTLALKLTAKSACHNAYWCCKNSNVTARRRSAWIHANWGRSVEASISTRDRAKQRDARTHDQCVVIVTRS